MKRIVQLTESGNALGSWQIECTVCPLKQHLLALGQPARSCVSGIETRRQGHVTLHFCEHNKPEAVAIDDANVLTTECRYGEATIAMATSHE